MTHEETVLIQDLKVLNHEGSVADCASVAGLAALAHFRRPDVTLQGDVIQVGKKFLKDECCFLR